MNDALNIIPAKVRAAIYAALLVVNAVVTPLMATGTIPAYVGAIVLAVLNVFGSATALANVTPGYSAKHVEPAPVAAPVND